jgi:hypothetical protein
VADIEAGDKVRTSEGFKRVVYIHHGGPCPDAIQVSYQAEDGQCGRIGLTRAHLIYTAREVLVQAGDLKVGDPIEVRGLKATVTGLTPISCNVRSLITTNGELWVDAVRVSSYAYDEKLHRFTASVSWLSHVSPKIPDQICGKLSPAFVKWVLPFVARDFRRMKKQVQMARRAQQKEPLPWHQQRFTSLVHVSA